MHRSPGTDPPPAAPSGPRTRPVIPSSVALLALLAVGRVPAAEPTGLLDLSLEDLVDVPVASAGLSPSPLRGVPALADVLTREQLRAHGVAHPRRGHRPGLRAGSAGPPRHGAGCAHPRSRRDGRGGQTALLPPRLSCRRGGRGVDGLAPGGSLRPLRRLAPWGETAMPRLFRSFVRRSAAAGPGWRPAGRISRSEAGCPAGEAEQPSGQLQRRWARSKSGGRALRCAPERPDQSSVTLPLPMSK